MCWSGEASAVLAAIGLSTTAYAAYKKEPTALWVCLGYFSLMELLQAFTYSVINQCSLPSNQIATFLGYLHIAFQPFFINALSMHFIDQKIKEKIQGFVYALCFVGSLFTIIQLYPFDWAGVCVPGELLCGKILCSVSGNWHIAWLVPVNGLGNFSTGNLILGHGFPGYSWVAFYLPMLYGSWRVTTYHILFGPTLSAFLTTNNNESPAVWCLLSIGLLLIVVKTPIRGMLYVKRWWLWPKAWTTYANK